MIITTIDKLQEFKNIIPSYKEIQNFDFNGAEAGKHELTKNDFLFIFEKELMEDNLFECHKKYIDIHIPIKETETIGFIDFKNYKVTQEFSEKDDVSLGECIKNKTTITLEVGQIAIFMPGEPHQPWLGQDNKLQKKSVVKILVNHG